VSAGEPGKPGKATGEGGAGGIGGRGEPGGPGGTGGEGHPGGAGGTGGEGHAGHGGGPGGHGGRGERGERGESGKSGHGFGWRDALLYSCVFAACFYTYVSTTSTVNKVDRQGDRTSFETLRNCIRANVNSAVIKSSVAQHNGLGAPIAKALYPIVDCKAGVLTGHVVELSPAETQKYVAIVVKGRAPIINKGKVIGSRPTILEGLNNVDQAGKVPPGG
jgi:hypothetical protein